MFTLATYNELMKDFHKMDSREQQVLFNLAIKALSYEVHLDFLQDIKLLRHIHEIKQTPEVGFLLAYFDTYGDDSYKKELVSAFEQKRINASSHQLRILPRQHEMTKDNRIYFADRVTLQKRQKDGLPFELHLETEINTPSESLCVKVIATYDNTELELGYLSKEEARLLACPLQSKIPYYSQIKFHGGSPTRTRTPEIYILFLNKNIA